MLMTKVPVTDQALPNMSATPQILGMVSKVNHLVKVEEVK